MVVGEVATVAAGNPCYQLSQQCGLRLTGPRELWEVHHPFGEHGSSTSTKPHKQVVHTHGWPAVAPRLIAKRREHHVWVGIAQVLEEPVRADSGYPMLP
jgi:hypothetical protein